MKGLDIFSLKAIFSVCDNLNGIVFNNCDFRLDFISLMRDGKFGILINFKFFFSSQFGGVHVVEKVFKLKELVLTSNTRSIIL